VCGDIRQHIAELSKIGKVDLVHGGPPCQGFSVAGKMDPTDPRSELLWEFVEVVKTVKPRSFICENVAALGRLEKWRTVRQCLLKKFRDLGYSVSYIVLPAYKFGVPQKRERVFFLGLRDREIPGDLTPYFQAVMAKAPTVREVFLKLGRPGTKINQGVCNAKITIAQNPVMRRSPYAGMLFNGLGRPLNPDDYSATMHASMGGNKTPFIDEVHLYEGGDSWVEAYHADLIKGKKPRSLNDVPSRLRRITVTEAKAIQTFPLDYKIAGKTSAQFRQIGNAVPCKLGEAVARVVKTFIENKEGDLLQNGAYNGELPIQLR
jgi:DNA (cytosine-5)-methyltransferase 1